MTKVKLVQRLVEDYDKSSEDLKSKIINLVGKSNSTNQICFLLNLISKLNNYKQVKDIKEIHKLSLIELHDYIINKSK